MEGAGTKKCPLCAEEIETGASVCPYCGARFEVTRRGYCTACHAVVTGSGEGTCPNCGGALIDEMLESRFIGERPRPAVGPPAAPSVTPVAVAAPTVPAEAPAAPAWVGPLPAAATVPAASWAPPAEQAGLGPPPAETGEAAPKRRRWLPWVIGAAVVAAAGAGVLTWWLLRGEEGGTTPSTTSVPADEVDALSAYLVAVLEAEVPVGEASSAANAAATTQQAADTQRALAAAFGLYGRRVADLDPPSSAREHQSLVVELADTANTLYLGVAEALADNDTTALLAVQGDLIDWMNLAIEEATLRELLINTALSAHADVPLNRYLLDTGAVRSAVFADFEAFLGRVQQTLAAGQWETSIDQIEEEIGIIDGFLADWGLVVPPPEAAAYHSAQGEAVRALRDAVEPLMSALESQSITGVQGSLGTLVRAAAEAQEVLIIRNELIIGALGGSAGEPFALAGTWSGLVNDPYSPTMRVTITIDTYCEVGQVCGTFDIPELPCKGTYTYVGQHSPPAPHEFRAGDLEGACGVGRDFLRLLPDGTVQYSATGDWGTTSGILTRVGP